MPKNLTDPQEIVRRLNMFPHPEGGYYAETYRSSGIIAAAALPPGFGGDRAHSTAIIYLLPEGRKSKFHRLLQDEVWHFYLGGPLRLVMIHPSGQASEVILGSEIEKGHHLQFTVPAGTWFAATPRPGAVYSLTGCTVAPGFDFADFEIASAPELKKAFPTLYGLIGEFT
jgi:Uncharacterized conserved protein